MDALRLTDVRVDYPGRPGVLAGVRLRLAPGELAVVRGRSGSGKSSLLNLAAGLQVPTAGRVEILGEPLDPKDAGQRARIRGRHVGLVLQHLHLLGELTLAQNIALPIRLANRPRKEELVRTRDLLRAFGLVALARRRPAQCSGGEQQRAAIARALALQPALLVVDEPTSALDVDAARTVVQALRLAAQQGAAVLVASHDDLLTEAGRVLLLQGGRLAGGNVVSK